MQQPPVEFLSATVNVRVGNVVLTANVNPIFDYPPPTPPSAWPAVGPSPDVFANNGPAVANDAGSPPGMFDGGAGAFPSDPAAPHVSGKLGDGKLLEAGLRIFKLLRELGILKA